MQNSKFWSDKKPNSLMRSKRPFSSVLTTPVMELKRMSMSWPPRPSSSAPARRAPGLRWEARPRAAGSASSDTARRGASVMKKRRAFSRTSCSSTFSLYSRVSFSL